MRPIKSHWILPIFFIFIEKPEQSLDELTSITHRLIKACRPPRYHQPRPRPRSVVGGTTCSAGFRLEPPITPVLLAWSVAQRVNHESAIRSSIEHVPLFSLSKTLSCRSLELGEVVSDMSLPNKITNILTSSFACIEYWRNLGSSRYFTNHTLRSCVNVIHEDIISVWNFDDRENVSHFS